MLRQEKLAALKASIVLLWDISWGSGKCLGKQGPQWRSCQGLVLPMVRSYSYYPVFPRWKSYSFFFHAYYDRHFVHVSNPHKNSKRLEPQAYMSVSLCAHLMYPELPLASQVQIYDTQQVQDLASEVAIGELEVQGNQLCMGVRWEMGISTRWTL